MTPETKFNIFATLLTAVVFGALFVAMYLR
jgi:hypothetical protein